MSTSKIQLTGITKVFATDDVETHALRGIDLTIKAGDFASITGPSGCGKSTLLSILGLLDAPSSGQYLIDGEDVSRLTLTQASRVRNEKIGFIFQSFNLIGELSVAENVALPLRYRREALEDKVIATQVAECLEKVGLSHRAGHRPGQLSGGQQQRVAIARALVGRPSVLLVDEPTGNLDSKSGDAVMQLLCDLNDEGVTLCMVTHDPRYAQTGTTQLHLLDGVISDKQAVEQRLEEMSGAFRSVTA
jgi:putative ABC transport system ATP-binding protein